MDQFTRSWLEVMVLLMLGPSLLPPICFNQLQGCYKLNFCDDVNDDNYDTVVYLLIFFIISHVQGKLVLSDIGLAEKRVYHAALNGNSLPSVLRQKED